VPIVVTFGGIVPIALLACLFVAYSASASPVRLAAAVIGGLGGAASLVVHELGHVRAARRVGGARPTVVSLMSLGAATRFEGAHRKGREQARVAAGGPAASLALAVVLLVVAFVAVPLPQGLRYAAFGLALLNILIACLNVLPVPPLDGHKLLVGLAWWLAGSEAQGKQIARSLGQIWLIVELVSAATPCSS
jgi:Zn-dependent protease